jgi:hypothetical protein
MDKHTPTFLRLAAQLMEIASGYLNGTASEDELDSDSMELAKRIPTEQLEQFMREYHEACKTPQDYEPGTFGEEAWLVADAMVVRLDKIADELEAQLGQESGE